MRYIILILLTLLGYGAIAQPQQEVELCPGKRNSFNYFSEASTSGGGWLWMFNSDTIANNDNVRITWRDTGFYVITVVYKNECGEPTRNFKVKVVKCPESAIFFPSAFTPNGDGLNDGWSPIPFKIVEMKWQIYNRYGELVYTSKGIEDKWDGKHKGTSQGTFAFVYQCWWRGIDGKTGFKKGTVTLIR